MYSIQRRVKNLYNQDNLKQCHKQTVPYMKALLSRFGAPRFSPHPKNSLLNPGDQICAAQSTAFVCLTMFSKNKLMGTVRTLFSVFRVKAWQD